ncbi:hypothetical protein [Vibrio phage VP41s3]|nr:hypothetical protein [Vibrio phage VP41s3]
MADKMTGTITAKARTGKSIQMDDGNWYSAFNASQIGEVDKGDTVEFSYKVNGRYRNIQGNVTKSAGGSSSEGGASKSTGGRSGGGRTYRANGEEGGFPIHPLAYERALDRRNAVSAASAIIAAEIGRGSEYEDVAEATLSLARTFEAYSTGDEERLAMAAMMGGDAE